FGNAGATASPIEVSADGTEMKVVVPRLATPGYLTVVQPSKRKFWRTETVPIVSFRNTNAFAFHNFDVQGYSMGDLSDLFGWQPTYLGWWIMPDPFVFVFKAAAEAALDDGQCYGISRTSQQMMHGARYTGSYPVQPGYSQNKPTIWQLDGPGGPSD